MVNQTLKNPITEGLSDELKGLLEMLLVTGKESFSSDCILISVQTDYSEAGLYTFNIPDLELFLTCYVLQCYKSKFSLNNIYR